MQLLRKVRKLSIRCLTQKPGYHIRLSVLGYLDQFKLIRKAPRFILGQAGKRSLLCIMKYVIYAALQ